MGPKLVTPPKSGNYDTCKSDADCLAIAGYNSNSCCMYTRLIEEDPRYFLGINENTYMYMKNRQTDGGWSNELDTYTKVCKNNYPDYFKDLGSDYSPTTLVYESLYDLDKWTLYCDNARVLTASALATVGVIAFSTY